MNFVDKPTPDYDRVSPSELCNYEFCCSILRTFLRLEVVCRARYTSNVSRRFNAY